MRKTLFIIAISLSSALFSFAGDNPFIKISLDAKTADGTETTGQTSVDGSAPIEVTFNFETLDADDWTISYEWRFAHEGESLDQPYMVRYESSPQVTFTQAGTDSIALYATFTKDNATPVEFKSSFWRSTKEASILTVHATESDLKFPNAFSPNGDGINDTYKPKSYTSIVSFRAIIFNRWGQKIYEWNDVAGEGWDGKFNGHDVKQGTYYVYCKAKGADGNEFNIKKDVNLLRSYDVNADTNSTGSTTE